MIASVITALIANYMTTAFVIGLLVAGIQVLRQRRRHVQRPASELFLNNYLLWAVGVAEAVNFVMHSVFGDFAASSIGWAQSPFQLELAFASLGIAVMAFILHGRSTQLRAKVALVAATAVFAFGAAGGHVYQIVVNHDYAVNNTGLLLVMDIVIAVVGIALVGWTAASRRSAATPVERSAAPVLVANR